MAEKAIILDSAWYAGGIEGEDALARFYPSEEQVVIYCFSDFDQRVILDFSELKEIYEAMLEVMEQEENQHSK